MYVVCSEHIAEAIDEFIDNYETSPDIHDLGQISFTDWTAPSCCMFCDRPPVYLVV